MTENCPIPQSYNEWRHFISEQCGISLTRVFVEARIKELNDDSNPRTREFREKYGLEHLNRVIGWFETTLREAK